eukprot:6194792-Pleurochrysis_carterae.AAC.1
MQRCQKDVSETYLILIYLVARSSTEQAALLQKAEAAAASSTQDTAKYYVKRRPARIGMCQDGKFVVRKRPNTRRHVNRCT